jgi:DNA-directed RNA polymerase subunit RPC12/RpoP
VDVLKSLTYSTCKSCSARLLWVLTQGGRRMPLDEHPVSDGSGNVLIERDDRTGEIRGRVLTGAELPHDGPAYVPHHRTCPEGEQWKTRRAAGPRCSRCGERLDEQLAALGYTRHVGCMDAPRPPAPATAATAPVEPVAEQGSLFDLGGAR